MEYAVRIRRGRDDAVTLEPGADKDRATVMNGEGGDTMACLVSSRLVRLLRVPSEQSPSILMGRGLHKKDDDDCFFCGVRSCQT